jgi:cupin 2 domain-containing protein
MARARRGNLFAGLPAADAAELPDELPAELIDVLVERDGVRIERIVSTGQASPAGFWYDQAEDEFVVLLAGSAVLRFEQEGRLVCMAPGDWVEIPARVRHRVESTAAGAPTVWLAVHRAPANRR